MGYERYPRNTNPQGNYYGRNDPQDYGRDYGSGGSYSYSSARDFESSGEIGPDRGYGPREQGSDAYGRRGMRQQQRGSGRPYYGSYAHDGHRFDEASEDGGRPVPYGARGSGYGGAPQGYDYDERGFLDRAGDEVRSWFGDDEAERRRAMDQRQDERHMGNHPRDADYHNWRRGQIDALDRDYHEYRRENQAQFEQEFGSWRKERQTQRGALGLVTEHMEVIGSDGEHIGTVDKVRGDRILLTKNDADAGGRHHSIPSRWIDSVDDKVKVRKTADEAQAHWRDEEGNQAMFGEGRERGEADRGAHLLNRSFSGTY